MSLPTHYIDSKGQEKDIATMHFPYLKNALEKLKREGDPRRKPEIEAMEAEMVNRNQAYRLQLAEERTTASPERQAEIDTIIADMDAAAALA